ncbi:hypothetical protein PCE1_004261 [Barthelona sp. PCE]
MRQMQLNFGGSKRPRGKFMLNEDNTVLCYYSPGAVLSTKIAAFDLDDTLISALGKSAFAKRPEDHEFIGSSSKLQRLVADGYTIVIYSNQRGVSTGRTTLDFLKKKIRFVSSFFPPFIGFFALEDCYYRKSGPGMHYLYMKNFSALGESAPSRRHMSLELDDSLFADEAVLMADPGSFYVGDAAGRSAAKGKKKDHAITDLLFALNAKLEFYTPEQYWGRHDDRVIAEPTFNPSLALQASDVFEGMNALPLPDFESNPTLFVMIAVAASGKSTVCEYLEEKGVVRVSRDILGSMEKCEEQAESVLMCGKSAVIDNTNVDIASRSQWINLAKRLGVPVVGLRMSVAQGMSLHLNRMRKKLQSFGRLGDKYNAVPTFVIIKQSNAMEMPTRKEGFNSVIQVPLKLSFEDEVHARLFLEY